MSDFSVFFPIWSLWNLVCIVYSQHITLLISTFQILNSHIRLVTNRTRQHSATLSLASKRLNTKMDTGQTIYDSKLWSTWEAQEASPQHMQQLIWRDQDLVSDCQLPYLSLAPCFQIRTNQWKSNMLPNQSHKVPAFIWLPPASHTDIFQSEPLSPPTPSPP